MKGKWLVIGTVLLLVATCVVAAVHLANQEDIACLQIRQAEQRMDVSFRELDSGVFSGVLTDGKGDRTHGEYTGILLGELLEKKGIALDQISGVTVTSADQYSVTFTARELMQPDKVYVAITANGKEIPGIEPGSSGVQIIVFADPDSRRCVRYAQIITVE